MPALGLEHDVVDRSVYDRTVERFRERKILLPTFAELAEPRLIPSPIRGALAAVKPDDANPLNLFRVHWYNDADRTSQAPLPGHVVLPKELTGVDARIVLLFGDRFPMVRCHKALATYGCLAPRVITGQFDPTSHRAVWPSTGNYCRGGVAVSRIMSCRAMAVLPEGMSRERFSWLEDWVAEPDDIIATPGVESNVKEIYDKCAELSLDPANVIFNQFSDFGNHLAHYLCTGRALGHVFDKMRETEPSLRMTACVLASGSSGTLGAADYLKESYGVRIVAVEALECPTMLYNGFGAHNIQGIGDKHIPLIHNVYNTDIVTAVTDRATDQLAVLFSSAAGLAYLAEHQKVPTETLAALSDFGLSSICNILAAVKIAKYLDLGPDDVVMTVATDGAELYASERTRIAARDFPDGFDEPAAAETFARWILGAETDHLLETNHEHRERIFNLGYYTWVEQQGLSIRDFVARREQCFWTALRANLAKWDEMIREFNSRTGVSVE
jgi:cysteine synthase